MADLTYEILTDRTKYPDDMEITLAGDQKVTVREFRDRLMPKSDFTRQSETWAKKERDLQAALEGTQAQLRDAMKPKDEPAPQPAPRSAGEYSYADLEKDPVLGLLTRKLREQEDELKLHRETFIKDRNAQLQERFTNILGTIKRQHNERYNGDGKGSNFDEGAFLDWVQRNPIMRNGIVDLDLSYREYNRGNELEWERTRAREEGREKGRSEVKVPSIPTGKRRSPVKPKDLPEDFQSITDQMLDEMAQNDPEISAALRGDDV